MASTHDWLFGFWSTKALDDSKTGYLFCGVRVGSRHVLTVKHGMVGRKDCWARQMSEATSRYKATVAARHPQLDAALLRLEAAPPRFQPPTIVTTTLTDQPHELVGVFEGASERKTVQLKRPDTNAEHYLFAPEQPKGVSGGAVCRDASVWGMAIRRYTDENIGCALPIHALLEWLNKALEKDGEAPLAVATSDITPSAKPALNATAGPGHAIVTWLARPKQSALRANLIEAANSIATEPAVASAEAALERLAAHQGSGVQIAGVHLLGRALRKTREDMDDAAYLKDIAPRVPDLLAAVVAKAFDCDCTAVRDEAGADHPLVRQTSHSHTSINAMLAAQLFGGSLQFEQDAEGLWRPQWVLELNCPPNGDQAEAALLREAHRRLLKPQTAAALASQQQSAPLTPAELLQLKRRIRELVDEDECLLVFVEAGASLSLSPSRAARARSVASTLQANLMLTCDSESSTVLRMDAADFEITMQRFLDRYASARPPA